MLPTREEWERIFSRAEEYVLTYLSTPEMWGGQYNIIENGEEIQLFYDNETSNHMKGRPRKHLIYSWVVSIRLVGSEAVWSITNTKYVGIWNLEVLLSGGTKEYESEEIMHFWSRFNKGWSSTKKRKGIRPEIVEKFNQLGQDAIDYGMQKAVDDWYGRFE